MYFNHKNNFYHGIMFHHFHDGKKHLKGQGSITKDEFYKILNFIGLKNILNADIFFEKSKNNTLKNNEVCITFDDSVKCQIDVALPVLEDLKIKSFFFVYTSIFDGKPDYLELFRYFRTNYFENINKFYEEFYDVLNEDLNNFFLKNQKIIQAKKIKFPFYSFDDIKFRLVRDFFLTKSQYESIMFSLIKNKKLNHKDILNKLFFEKKDLINLDKLGHLIGLHSHSHPTKLEKLSYEDQKNEYKKNLNIISKVLDKSKSKIKYMSHPCGSYNNNTLSILKELGIQLGFKQIMTLEKEKGMTKINNSTLEIARQDHIEIYRKIKL